ncbi:hypothetical protein HYH02_001687 [Chlamydomonas schloesseri]|uniref:DNA helicase n=1 Tax=Chlamydomonas schloesseri TaxID=2026947 RepID=A0A835WVI5_9CHLO|nr:hypothetical protein HYH02_001687 [Chlamydomonas schloesseri]|eukprot:KAG2453466.1 hypothetical protein HYH02_001687 [Chlamydomonas schloesseri]
MGKKQPLAAVQKQKGGTDITKFFGRKPSGGKDATPGRTAGVAGVRAPGGRAPTPGKHLLDNVLLSQDVDDGLQVVWASSPTAALSPQKATGESQDTARTASQQQTQGGNNSQASRDGFRRALVLAAQKAASDVLKPEADGAAGGGGSSQRASQGQSQARPMEQQHDENAAPELQQLLERKSSHGLASTSAPGGDGGPALKRRRSGKWEQLCPSDTRSAAAAAAAGAGRPVQPPGAQGSDAAAELAYEEKAAAMALTIANVDASGLAGTCGAAAAPPAINASDTGAIEADAAMAAAAAAFDAEEEQLLAEAMAGLEYTTPAAARQQARLARSALRRNTDAGRAAAGGGTPALPSLGIGPAAAAGRKRPLLTCSTKKCATASGSGRKRRALLDLLDQVELMVKQRTQPSQAAAGAPPPSSGAGEERLPGSSRLAPGCTSAAPMAMEDVEGLPAPRMDAVTAGNEAPDSAAPASQTPPPLVGARAGATPEPGGLTETPAIQAPLDMVACTLVSPTQPLQTGPLQPGAAACPDPGTTQLATASRAMPGMPEAPGQATGRATSGGLQLRMEVRAAAPGPYGDLAPLGGPEPAPIVLRPPTGKVLAPGSAPASAKTLNSMSLADDEEDDLDVAMFNEIDKMCASHTSSTGNSSRTADKGSVGGTQAATGTACAKAGALGMQMGPTQAVAPIIASGCGDAVPLTQALQPHTVVVGPASRLQRPPLAPTTLPAASSRQEPSRQPQQPAPSLSQLLPSRPVQPAPLLQPAAPALQPPQQHPQPLGGPEPAQPAPVPPAHPQQAVAGRASVTSGGWSDDDDDAFDVDVDAVIAKAVSNSRPASPSAPMAAAAGAPAMPQVPSAPGVGPPLQSVPAGLEQPPPALAVVAPAHQPHLQLLPRQHQSHAVTATAAAIPAVGIAGGTSSTQEAGIGVLGGSGGREDYHHVVMEVQVQYVSGGSRRSLLRLRCFNQHKGNELLVLLRDMWAEQEVRPGDSANVLGGRPVDAGEACPAVEINAEQGLFVLHPDVLLSGTSVIKDCVRQAWLGDRVSGGLGSESALRGNISHELLQRCLQPALEGRLDEARMRLEARAVVRARAPELVQQAQLAQDGTCETSLEKHLDDTIRQLLAWVRTYVAPDVPGPTAAAAGGGGGAPIETRLGGTVFVAPTSEAEEAPLVPPEVRCRVDEVLDIEENIWAPKYGIKGQIDATFRVSMSVKDPLHNQLTLHGGLASKMQQQQQVADRTGGEGDGGSGPTRFHGHRHRASDGGAPLSAPAGSGLIGNGPRPQQLPASAAGAGTGQAQAPALQRQNSWSAGLGAMTARQQAPHQAQALPGVQTESLIVPFEYKSGHFHQEHTLQVLLYLLLMEDRYRTAVRKGLLFHLGTPHMAAVSYSHATLASVMVKRNRLAAHLVGAASRPPPPLGTGNNRACDYCYAKTACAVYLAAEVATAAAAEGAAQGGAGGGAEAMTQAPGSGSGQQLQGQQQPSQTVSGRLLQSVHADLRTRVLQIPAATAAFFAHWSRLVDLEEQAARGNRGDLWALSGEQREQLGGCVSRLVFCREEAPVLPPQEQQRQQQQGDADGEARYCYVFTRQLAPALAGCGGVHTADAAPGMAAWQGAASADAAGGLLSAGFAPGDMGVLSVEGRHVNAARVTVAAVTQDTITLSSRKRINVNKLTWNSDGAGSSCSSSSNNGSCLAPGPRSVIAPLTWRLDRDESASHFTLQRSNLALLALPEVGASYGYSGPREMKSDARNGVRGKVGQNAAWRTKNLEQLRRLVVDLEPPQQGSGFVEVGSNTQQQTAGGGGGPAGSQVISSQVVAANSYLRRAARDMNGEQLAAVSAALTMCDYSILLGMPGTGKTTTIVHIIRALVAANVRVFVSSYTNSAVDNILLKLAASLQPDEAGTGASAVKFVRLGSAHSVHPGVRRFMPGGAAYPDTSVAGLQRLMNAANVVGCTCLSVNSPLLTCQSFGVVILDEASQVTLPASLGPLALGRSFLLVGDHYQLSPLVQSREAAAGGLGVSLFRRLSEAHPQAVVTLSSQYRMCADIMALSNVLVYNGRMRCGSEAVANTQLHLPRLYTLVAPALPNGSAPSSWPAALLPAAAWLQAALAPEVRVVFLDTDGAVGCGERVLQDGVVNPGEVRLVHGLVAALAAAGLPPGEVGVASPYKAQVAALQGALAGFSLQPLQQPQQQQAGDAGAAAAGVEVLTIDRYQGRDKAAILLSLVRSNPERAAGRLLADWQRLNVALTRARTKLLLVGSAATASSIPMLAELLRLLAGRPGGVVRLPPSCLDAVPALTGSAVVRNAGRGQDSARA